MRYQHLHSEVRQNVNQRILQQWRSILCHHNCQTRHVSSLPPRSNKVTQFLNSIDNIEERQLLSKLKSSGKKRIPVHVTNKINNLPSILTIQSYLQRGDSELAWKAFDQIAPQLAQKSIPHSTSNQLLVALFKLVNSNAHRLLQHNCKLQYLYYTRLESLAGVIRQNKEAYFDKEELGMALYLYGKLNMVKRAESLFKNMSDYTNAPATVKDYNHLMTVYLRQLNHVDTPTQKRYLSKIHSLYQEISKKQLEPNTQTYNLTLAAQVKLQDFRGAEKFFSQMTVKPNVNTYNIFLNGYLKTCRNQEDRDKVQLWMERLANSGYAPKRSTYYSIVDGLAEQAVYLAKAQDHKELQETVDSVTRMYDVMLKTFRTPDTQTINALLKCYTAANYTKGIEKVMATLILPEKKGGCGNCGSCGCGGSSSKKEEPIKEEIVKVEPDIYTFNMLIKYHLAQEQVDQAFQMYDTMINCKLEPDTVTYNNFIWYYADQGNVKELLRYIDVMQKKGIPYNNHLYNTLLNCSLKYPKEAELLDPHLRIMVALGVSTPDAVSRNTVLSRYEIEANETAETNFERYTDILERNLYDDSTINTRTYNTILQSAGKFYKPNPKYRGISDKLDEIISSLDISQVKPDVYTYALNIRNAANIGQMDKAEAVFQAMVDAGIKPNEYVFSHLIHGYSALGEAERAHNFLERMTNDYKIKATAFNYAPVIKGYAEIGDYEKSFKLFRDMLIHKVRPDLVIYTILANVLLLSPFPKNEQRAIKLLERLEKGGIALDAAALSTLAKAYSQEILSLRDCDMVEQRKAELISACIQKVRKLKVRLKKNEWLDARAVSSIISAFNSFNDPQATWKLWHELRAIPYIQFSTIHYNAALTGLVGHKLYFPGIKFLYEEMEADPSVAPDAHTLELVIWAAYDVTEYQMIRDICNKYDDLTLSHVRAVYAALTALLHGDQVDAAKKVFKKYKESSSSQGSTAVWAGLITKMAQLYDLEK